MKKNLIYFAFYVLICNCANAQNMTVTTDSSGRMVTNFSSRSVSRRGGISYLNYTVLGSPFLGGSPWHLGTITLDNQTVIPVSLSFDLMNGTLYTLDSVSQTNIIIKPKTFTFEGAKFVGFKTQFLGIKNWEYGNLIYDGKTKLLVKLRKTIGRPNNFHFAGFNEDGIYMANNQYYIQKQNGDFEHINLNNKSILAKLGDKKNEIAEFLQSSKINNEKDLIAVLKFYDGLVEN